MAKLVTPDGKQLNIFLNLDDSDDGNGAVPLKYGSKNHSGMNFVVSAFRNFKTNYDTCVKLIFHNSSGEMELDIASLISTNPSSTSKMTVVSGTSVYFIEDDLLLETTSGKITRIDIYEASPDIVTELDSRVFTLESQDTSKPNFVAIDSSGYKDFMLMTDKGTLYTATPYTGESPYTFDDNKGRDGLMGLSPISHFRSYSNDMYDTDSNGNSYFKFYRDSNINIPIIPKSGSFTTGFNFSGRHPYSTTMLNNTAVDNCILKFSAGPSGAASTFPLIEKAYISQENHGTYQWAIRLFVKQLDGYIYGWGYNNTGALGTGDGVYTHNKFQKITDIGTNPKYLGNHGAHYGCLVAQKSDGTILVCGSNASGQLGNGSTSQLNYLTDVTSNWIPYGTKSDWTIVKSFGGFGERYNGTSGAVLGMWLKHNDGTDIIRMCGWGGNGALGHGSNSNSTTPVTAFQGHQIRQVEWYGSVYGGVMVVTEDDKLYGWGRNNEYQLGLGHKQSVSSSTELFVVHPEILSDGQSNLDTSTNPLTNISIDETFQNGYRNQYFPESDNSIPLDDLPAVKRIVCCKGPSTYTYQCPIFIEDTAGLIHASGYNVNGEAGIGADASNLVSSTYVVHEPANFGMHSHSDVSGQYSKFWRRVLFPTNGKYWWDYHPNYTGPQSPSDKFPNIKFISPCFSTTNGKTSYVAVTEDNEIYCWGFNGNDSFWNQSDVHSNILSPTLLNKKFHVK